ncbi:glycosyltransferase family 4 protein [Stygiolobus azoricus]|uniref:Glycosyltransferase n=1 Tax=Stygiolobus azoricus TaxID=41675 RepID=A0A650CPI2_9CREN|nr:glycosyltransferase family 4 protein [Stygiolobus azoricus]QGR19754.1 glycosyltransferase [Stygiolobus azoricus]
MKILFALIGTGLAGGVRYIFEVANGLKDKGHDVKIVALAGDHSWFKNLRAEVIYRPLNMNRFSSLMYTLFKIYKYMFLRSVKINPRDFFYAISFRLGVRPDFIFELAELIRNFDSDVTVATYYLTAFSVWFSQNKNPFYLMQDFPELVEENEGKLGLNIFYQSLKLPFSFITVSSYAKQLIVENNPTAKVTIAHPGVDLNVFRPRSVNAQNRKKRVMVILRGSRLKGDEVAMEVLKNLNKKLPIHAVLVGSKSLVKHYSKSIGLDFEYSVFSNVSDEVLAELYSSSDAFLHTSYAESFGLPPLEAMACGTPVVMTDNKGSRDYAINNFNALVSQPGDINSLANNLLKVLQDDKLRERLIENGLETAKKFTWNSTVDNFEKALKE